MNRLVSRVNKWLKVSADIPAAVRVTAGFRLPKVTNGRRPFVLEPRDVDENLPAALIRQLDHDSDWEDDEASEQDVSFNVRIHITCEGLTCY